MGILVGTYSSPLDDNENSSKGIYAVSFDPLDGAFGPPRLVAKCLNAEARELLLLHHEHYRVFWSWADRNVENVLAGGTISTPMGWQFRQGMGTLGNPRSILNWPMQSAGADALRLSCVRLMNAGIKICTPVHDAILIEAPADRLDHDIEVTRSIMVQACRDLFSGHTCRVDADTILAPDRYMDMKRGLGMWNTVMRAVGMLEHKQGK